MPFIANEGVVSDKMNSDLKKDFPFHRLPFFLCSEGLCNDNCPVCYYLRSCRVTCNEEKEEQMYILYSKCKQRAFDFLAPTYYSNLLYYDRIINTCVIRDAIINKQQDLFINDPIVLEYLNRPDITNYFKSVECRLFCKTQSNF